MPEIQLAVLWSHLLLTLTLALQGLRGNAKLDYRPCFQKVAVGSAAGGGEVYEFFFFLSLSPRSTMRRQMFQLTDAAFDCKYAITWKAFLSNLVCPFLSSPPSPGAILPTCKLTSWRVRLLKSTHISLSQILSPSLLSQIIFLSLLTLMAWLIFRNNFRRLKIFLKARKNKLDADTAVCVSNPRGTVSCLMLDSSQSHDNHT